MSRCPTCGADTLPAHRAAEIERARRAYEEDRRRNFAAALRALGLDQLGVYRALRDASVPVWHASRLAREAS